MRVYVYWMTPGMWFCWLNIESLHKHRFVRNGDAFLGVRYFLPAGYDGWWYWLSCRLVFPVPRLTNAVLLRSDTLQLPRFFCYRL
jgi:hypothetical protein